MRKSLSYLMLLMGLLLAGPGCESPPKTPRVPFSAEGEYLEGQPGSGVVADPRSPIPDVPRPVGFRLLRSRSTQAAMEGEARHVRHVYQGRGEVVDVVTMYRRFLPRRGWQFVNREQRPGKDTVLRYVQGTEQLRVRVVEEGVISTLTAIVVEIRRRDPAEASPTP
ncbi:MAG: hypothetical protein ACODAQ_00680 [Phycisphaeraceae bacterium]